MAVTSVLMRLFEKIVREQLIEHLEANNLINDAQHGFRQQRSCLTQLLVHYDEILMKMEEGFQVDVIYCDFEKCFDKIDFNILLGKLQAKGVKGKALLFIKNFLTKRTFQVRVGTKLSDEQYVISGIPQGTVLGPLLMIVMNDDLGKALINSQVGFFADDTKMKRAIANENDVAILQSDLDEILAWSEKNNMKLNDDKFVVMSYNKKSVKNDYKLKDDAIITNEVAVRDHGITMTADANFSAHVSKIASESMRLISMIFRSFRSRDPNIIIPVYRAIVLSKIDYCSVLWGPTNLADIRKLEKVQADFTYRLLYKKDEDKLNYWERLKILRLYSIERRFERYCAIFVYKILHNLVFNPGIKSSYSERRGLKCIVPHYSGKLREGSFLIRGPKLFNSLPIEVRNFPFNTEISAEQSMNNFKHVLDDYLKTIEDKPNLSSNYTKYMSRMNNNGDRTNSIMI